MATLTSIYFSDSEEFVEGIATGAENFAGANITEHRAQPSSNPSYEYEMVITEQNDKDEDELHHHFYSGSSLDYVEHVK